MDPANTNDSYSCATRGSTLQISMGHQPRASGTSRECRLSVHASLCASVLEFQARMFGSCNGPRSTQKQACRLFSLFLRKLCPTLLKKLQGPGYSPGSLFRQQAQYRTAPTCRCWAYTTLGSHGPSAVLCSTAQLAVVAKMGIRRVLKNHVHDSLWSQGY